MDKYELVVQFPSSSGKGHYDIKLKDGKLSCNCPAWRFKTGSNGERGCKHTIAVTNSLSEYGLEKDEDDNIFPRNAIHTREEEIEEIPFADNEDYYAEIDKMFS